MARPFTWPEVTRLAPGESCEIEARYGEAARKIAAHEKRAGKAFVVTDIGDGRVQVVRIDERGPEQQAA